MQATGSAGRDLLCICINEKCLFTDMSRCGTCHHPIGDSGQLHGFCRSHAPCARGSRYCSLDCHTCTVLWDCAADYDHPTVSVPAFDSLFAWVEGFKRNSKNRPAGTSIFLYEEEEDNYDLVRFMAQSAKIVMTWEDAIEKAPEAVIVEDESDVISDPDSPQLTRSFLLRDLSPGVTSEEEEALLLDMDFGSPPSRPWEPKVELITQPEVLCVTPLEKLESLGSGTQVLLGSPEPSVNPVGSSEPISGWIPKTRGRRKKSEKGTRTFKKCRGTRTQQVSPSVMSDKYSSDVGMSTHEVNVNVHVGLSKDA